MCTWFLVAVTACGVSFAQTGGSSEYRVYQLQHKPVDDVQKMLADLLSEWGDQTQLVADARSNRILLSGPEKAHSIARELIESVDRAAVSPSTTKPVVRTYPCPGGRLAEVAADLRWQFSGRGDVRVSADADSAQLLVLAPPEVHKTIPEKLVAIRAGMSAAVTSSPTNAGTPPQGRFVSIPRGRIDRIEADLRKLLGNRLRPRTDRAPGQPQYWIVNRTGPIGELLIDRQHSGLVVFGTAALASQVEKLVEVLDTPGSVAGRALRVVPLRNADPAKVQQAYEAFRAGYKASPDASDGFLPGRLPHPQSLDQGSAIPHFGIQQVSYLFQESGGSSAAPAASGSANAGSSGTDSGGGEQIENVGVDVEIESLPDLDVIIVRGRERDVEEINRIIEEIERLSAEAEPQIEIYPLRHVAGDKLVEIVNQVNEQLIGGRQGSVSVTPLLKPNALLLIGWGEAVRAVKELIGKLDRPVEPATQFRIFPLAHAPAATIGPTIEQFLGGRGGLGPEIRVTVDPRTNSLLVYASHRDMEEVQALVQRLDTDSSQAVTRARIFKLENSLASDLAATLQGAIDSARGGGTAAEKSATLELLTFDGQGQQLLRSGILSEVEVTPDIHTNRIIVSGPADSMDLIAALIEQLDTPAAVSQIKVFRVINGDANSLALMLRGLLPSASGSAYGPQLTGAEGEASLVPVRFAVETRTNSIIATGSPGDLAIIEALLLRFDAEETQQRVNIVYRLRNAPATEVANSISLFLRSERQVQLAAPGAANPFQQIESEVIVVPEPVSNALIISATPRFFEDIRDLVEQIDAEPPQVVIQVLIVEVWLNDIDEFGVELGLQDSLLFDRSLLGNLLTTVETIQQSTPSGIILATADVIQAASSEPGYNFNNQALGNSGSDKALSSSSLLGGQGLSHFGVGRTNTDLGYGGLVLSASSESVSVLVRALQESRRLDVLSRPQIMTLDNQPAFIQVGKRVPRITGSTISTRGQINNIVLENVGLILGVTPRISPDGTVVMELDAEKSELDPNEGIPISVSTNGVPIFSPVINLATAQTTVSAPSGETVVIGGMITKNTAMTRRRVPYLADIPLLGHLFRFDSDVTRRSELLIILTPHVVRNMQDADRIKQIETDRIDWCLADVHAVHGPVGVRQEAVVYPDLNPRGIISAPVDESDGTQQHLQFSRPLESIPAPVPAPGVPALPPRAPAPGPPPVVQPLEEDSSNNKQIDSGRGQTVRASLPPTSGYRPPNVGYPQVANRPGATQNPAVRLPPTEPPVQSGETIYR